MTILTRVGDQRWRAKDLAAHLLWSPSRLSHHDDRMQRRELTNTPRRLPEGRGMDVVQKSEGLAAIQAAAPGHVAAVRETFID